MRLCWPPSKIGECVAALARRAGLLSGVPEAADLVTGSAIGIENAIEWHARQLGCDAEAVETTFQNLEKELSAAHPALLKVGEAGWLAVARGDRRTLQILTPGSTTRGVRLKRVPLKDVCLAIRAAVDQRIRPDCERLVQETNLPPAKQAKTVELLLAEQIAGKRFDQCWILRVSSGAGVRPWLRQANAVQNGMALIGAHTAQYLLWLASWAILGGLSFEGRLDDRWLIAWALLLVTLVPLRVFTTWLQGLLAVRVGSILKKRLLWGALRLGPDEVRHQGLGSFLGQALEAEAVETLALSGGIAGLLAAIEIAVAGLVLGGSLALLLCLWTALTVVLAWRFLRRHQQWTTTRMNMTQDLIESMVGHRTRLAQQPRGEWHEPEDQALDGYLQSSCLADRMATALTAAIPRGWLLAGLACLGPAIVSGQVPPAKIALAVGGVLLAYQAFRRLTASFIDVAAAAVAWQRIYPLFHAAERPENLRKVWGPQENAASPHPVIEADRLTYSYRTDGRLALQAGSLIIRRGERVLLEGSSGGGKSTLASLLAGLRTPDSGTLRLNGLDRHSRGDEQWRKQVVSAPQFHENHILTETLAFNLLMGRRWPPTEQDVKEAEALCRELGLSDLLERMPGGMMQMVGEGGWQLSHGERSRVYVARALLQNADLVILDESFAALDPENLKGALECTLQHAKTLMVIAHP